MGRTTTAIERYWEPIGGRSGTTTSILGLLCLFQFYMYWRWRWRFDCAALHCTQRQRVRRASAPLTSVVSVRVLWPLVLSSFSTRPDARPRPIGSYGSEVENQTEDDRTQEAPELIERCASEKQWPFFQETLRARRVVHVDQLPINLPSDELREQLEGLVQQIELSVVDGELQRAPACARNWYLDALLS
ncbi:hypothetical protein B0H14DRAFT_3428565 [Mycena olivaceomarginata]|nr:hypothetical protein B0H14DRAFT_3428565 [Mycena olivaceomarginata]